MTNNDKHIICGQKYESTIDCSVGELLLLLLKTHNDNVIMVDAVTNEKLRANEIADKAITFAKWLRNQNIGLGDVVSVMSENRLEFCVVAVATFFVGATFAPLNNDYTPRELAHVLSLSKPKLMICSEKTIDKMLKVHPNHPHMRRFVVFGTKSLKHRFVDMYEEIVKGCNGIIDVGFQVTPLDPKEAIATILCSSGTTGLPKGVMCPHYNMVTYVDIVKVVLKDVFDNDDSEDIMMGLVPFFHSMGFMLMYLNILRGKPMLVMSKFSPKLLLDAIVNHKISRIIVPPPVLLVILKNPLSKHYDLSCIKSIRCGAAALGKEMEMELQERFKVEHVSQAYGMTETTLGVLVTPQTKSKAGSVGTVIPGMMAKVIDTDGNALGPYMEGELCFKGPLIMKGYIGDPVSTAATIDKDQWLHTGDIGYYDEDKYFYIVDRLKELIKYKGFQVAPAELEALLLTHPAIQDSAVIGIPDEEAGELPLAYVVRKPDHKLSEKDVTQFVADNVSPQKKLRGGVIFVDVIPRNPSGKILRRELRDRIKKPKSKL